MDSLLAALVFLAAETAEPPMSAEDFDTFTRGRTFTFFSDGRAYGAESYLAGRRVVWAFDGGECVEGTWYAPQPGLICFVYDPAPDAPQCWEFRLNDGGLRARFAGDDSGLEVYEARRSPEPLRCTVPWLGS